MNECLLFNANSHIHIHMYSHIHMYLIENECLPYTFASLPFTNCNVQKGHGSLNSQGCGTIGLTERKLFSINISIKTIISLKIKN